MATSFYSCHRADRNIQEETKVYVWKNGKWTFGRVESIGYASGGDQSVKMLLIRYPADAVDEKIGGHIYTPVEKAHIPSPASLGGHPVNDVFLFKKEPSETSWHKLHDLKHSKVKHFFGSDGVEFCMKSYGVPFKVKISHQAIHDQVFKQIERTDLRQLMQNYITLRRPVRIRSEEASCFNEYKNKRALPRPGDCCYESELIGGLKYTQKGEDFCIYGVTERFHTGGLNGISKKNRKLECYAIFDGHGGAYAAEYCEKHFCEIFIDYLSDESKPIGLRETEQLEVATSIKAACLKINHHICEKDFDAHRELLRSGSPLIRGKYSSVGTTALVALKIGSVFYVGNVGDSIAMVIDPDKNNFTELNRLHTGDTELVDSSSTKGLKTNEFGAHYEKPSNNIPRLDDLAPGRSIGDWDRRVSCLADVVMVDARELQGKFLVLMSDGVEPLPREDICALFCSLKKKNIHPDDIAVALKDMAVFYRSKDDISIIIKYYPKEEKGSAAKN